MDRGDIAQLFDEIDEPGRAPPLHGREGRDGWESLNEADAAAIIGMTWREVTGMVRELNDAAAPLLTRHSQSPVPHPTLPNGRTRDVRALAIEDEVARLVHAADRAQLLADGHPLGAEHTWIAGSRRRRGTRRRGATVTSLADAGAAAVDDPPAAIMVRISPSAIASASTSPTWGRSQTAEGARSNERIVPALRDVSFTVPRGSVMAVIGRNGAGKTTLVRAIAGVLVPESGRIVVRGRMNLLVPGVGFSPALSGRENIVLGGLASGLSPERLAEISESIADSPSSASTSTIPSRPTPPE